MKTDAFTIKAGDVSKAHDVLDFASDNTNLEEAVDCLLEYAKALKKNPKNLLKPSRFIAKLHGQAMLGTVGKWRVSKTDHEDIKLPYENITQKKVMDIPIAEPTTNQSH